MGWFTAAEHLSEKAAEAFESLVLSGSSEASGVADCLNTIAENGGEQATDEYLIGCANNMIEAAKEFIKAVLPPLFDSLAAYSEKGCRVEIETVIMRRNTGDREKPMQYLQGSPLWTSFAERAFVFRNKRDAQWFIDHYPEELREAAAVTRT